MNKEKHSAENTTEIPRETDGSPAERAEQIGENLSQIEQDLAKSCIERQKQIDTAKQISGLTPSEVAEAEEEAALFDGTEIIQRKERSLVDEIKEKIAAYFGVTIRKWDKRWRIFDPNEEIRGVLEASEEKRPKLLREFKEKLAEQKERLAQMQAELIRRIRENPDVPLSELFEYVENQGERHGFTYGQRESAKGKLRKYEKKHGKIEALRDKFPDDRDLFRHIFGEKPVGKIQIVKGPMTLHIRIWDPEEYAYIFTCSFSREARSAVSKEKLEGARKSEGTIFTGISSVPDGALTIENYDSTKSDEDSEKIRTHEEQHAIEVLFEKPGPSGLWLEVFSAENTEEALQKTRSYLRRLREGFADNRARDEILAYFKDKRRNTEETLELFLKLGGPGDVYDYSSGEKKIFLNSIGGRNLIRKFGEGLKPVLEKLIDDVYKKEYEALLERCVKIPPALEKAGYSDDEVIAFLLQEPLQRWEKATRRLLEAQTTSKMSAKNAAGGMN